MQAYKNNPNAKVLRKLSLVPLIIGPALKRTLNVSLFKEEPLWTNWNDVSKAEENKCENVKVYPFGWLRTLPKITALNGTFCVRF